MTSPSNGPTTDRRRVKAIRDTYAAAWQMAGEIMADELLDEVPGRKPGHPDQHAAAATLFIQMCRLDATMVWMEKGSRIEFVTGEESVVLTSALTEIVELHQTIEELQQAVRDAGPTNDPTDRAGQ